MRTDKLSSLRQRLRRDTKKFEFDALIEGVSTLDGVTAEKEEAAPAPDDAAVEACAESAPPIAEAPAPASTIPSEDAALHAVEAAAVVIADEQAVAEVVLQGQTADAPPEEEPGAALPPRAVPSSGTEDLPVSTDRLRAALNTLGNRLLRESGNLHAAMKERAPEEAGFYLARVNHILELLHSLDSSGDLARQLGTVAAPPEGRSWPTTAWSVIEFAESPFSALLPPEANTAFVRTLLHAAWGVAIEQGGMER